MTEIRIDQLESPIGRIAIAVQDDTLCALDTFDRARSEARLRRRFPDARWVATDDPGGVTSRLRAWIGGALDALDDLPIDPGGTAFQQQVWKALRTIPLGETRSYGEIAREIGSPGASRAVGTANGLNPIWIVIPCHRVLNASGALGGYAGGLDAKRWLLAHEGVESI